MVEKFKRVLDRFIQDRRPVWLFAVLKMDDITDKWTLVVSAPWINDPNNKNEFEYIIGVLKEYFTNEELFTIARIGILRKTDHLIEELLKKQEGAQLKDEQINGNIIHEGLIISSNPNLVWPEQDLFQNNSSTQA
jgi:hypothetical protein